MNAFWMGGVWWEYTAVATAAAVFTLFFWNMGSLAIAREVHRKKVPNWVAGFFYMAQNPKKPSSPPDPRSGKLAAYIVRGMAVFLGMAFLLGFELHLWINVLGDHATVERALLVQLTLFLPFLILNFVPAYLFQRYLDGLPERDVPDEQL